MWGACCSCSGHPAPAPPHSGCFVCRLIFSIRCIQKKYSPAGLESSLNLDTPGLQTSPPLAETCSQGSALPTTPRDPTAGDGVFCHLSPLMLAPLRGWMLGRKDCALPMSRLMAEIWDDVPANHGAARSLHWQPGKAAKDAVAVLPCVKVQIIWLGLCASL